jgi:F0F1-type ATP synthase membrane subunit b/b'
VTQIFEKLGAFYLGRVQGTGADPAASEDLLYDTKDLTTHALCVGMTGSGKTGLCMSLLEEAGIDGIPAIVVDPKGDIGNLLLTFPQLEASDFRPWIDESEAARRDLSPDEFAQQTAEQWRQGLAQWNQDGARIERFRAAVDMAIYTPGSSAGLPLTVVKSFDAPTEAIIQDVDAFRDRVASAAAGLLALLGIDTDPVRSREFIFVSSLLDHAWRAGRDVSIAGLIQEIQEPPLRKIGVMDVETFYPGKERMELSMTLNSLLASPSFAGWLEGEPLDIKRLLYTPEGKPRISILSIAHLSESERMFFLTILLNELLAWVRTQPGTSSLRALFYMDEVFGYFPPVANPPCKTPMLTLLKQARAFGLGLVLATQNPVDLDYKGLSNCGTWFLGRLQTERDKARVLDGLEGASAQAGAQFDRQQMDTLLSGLASRVFLMNNVHEDHPVVFHTRWAMSYLRGPLTRDQIRQLMADQKREPEPAGANTVAAQTALPPAAQPTPGAGPPNRDAGTSAQTSVTGIPATVAQRYVRLRQSPPAGSQLVYYPALLGTGQLHFVRLMYGIDHWEERGLLRAATRDLSGLAWDHAQLLVRPLTFETKPPEHARHAPIADSLGVDKNYDTWRKKLIDALYKKHRLTVYKCTNLKEYSQAREAVDDFRIRLTHRLHEQRDEKIEELRDRYAKRIDSLEDQIRRARDQVRRAESEVREETIDTAISIGRSIFGALFSRKKLSRTNVDRASSSARQAGRVAREKADARRAAERLRERLHKREQLDAKIARDIARIEADYQPEHLEIEELEVRPRKKDITVEPVSVVWTPWFVDPSGTSIPAFASSTDSNT